MKVRDARILGFVVGALTVIVGGFEAQIEFVSVFLLLMGVIELLMAKKIIKGWMGGLISGFSLGCSVLILLKAYVF
jgi:hypothetical protein